MVGVVLKTKFVFSTQKMFSEYISYINRSEAVRNENFEKFSAYVGSYMDNSQKQLEHSFNSEKTSALFTRTKDVLTLEEKKALQDQFTLAQKNESPMWQNVISFDNRFLAEHGIFDPATGMFDEDKMRSVTRAAMDKMLKEEHMQESAVWSASAHFNTDNIHIHIAVVEPNPTRQKREFTYQRKSGEPYTVTQYRAALKPGTLSGMKSAVVNHIVDRSEDLKLMNDLIRKNFTGGKKAFYEDRKFKSQIQKIYSSLPADRRLWNYNMSATAKARPHIDALTDQLTQKYCKKEFIELHERLYKEERFQKSAYGESKVNGNNSSYKERKIREWYERKGNMILKSLKAYDKRQKENAHGKTPREKLRHLKNSSAVGSLQKLKRSLEKDFKSSRNQFMHEKLLQEIERTIHNEENEF